MTILVILYYTLALNRDFNKFKGNIAFWNQIPNRVLKFWLAQTRVKS